MLWFNRPTFNVKALGKSDGIAAIFRWAIKKILLFAKRILFPVKTADSNFALGSVLLGF